MLISVGFTNFNQSGFPPGVRLPVSVANLSFASQWMPVALDQPSGAFAGVPASGPTPEAVPQGPFHFLERPLRHDVAMVVGPAPDDGVELTDQVGLAESAILANQSPHLFQERVRVLLGRLDEQLAAILAEVLSEEVEPLFDRRDAGFLGRELQTPVAQKLLDQWFDFIFQHFLGRAGDDEVVRISNEVYLSGWASRFPRELLFRAAVPVRPVSGWPAWAR